MWKFVVLVLCLTPIIAIADDEGLSNGCESDGSFLIANSGCKDYYTCTNEEGSFNRTKLTCPDTKIFANGSCTYEAECPLPADFKCGTDGNYVRNDSKTCSSYITCTNGSATSVNCPAGNVFSWPKLTCVNRTRECPYLNTKVQEICTLGEGRYANPSDYNCLNYTLCSHAYNEHGDGYLVIQNQTCSRGFIFHTKLRRCVNTRLYPSYKCLFATTTAAPTTTESTSTTELSSTSESDPPTESSSTIETTTTNVTQSTPKDVTGTTPDFGTSDSNNNNDTTVITPTETIPTDRTSTTSKWTSPETTTTNVTQSTPKDVTGTTPDFGTSDSNNNNDTTVITPTETIPTDTTSTTTSTGPPYTESTTSEWTSPETTTTNVTQSTPKDVTGTTPDFGTSDSNNNNDTTVITPTGTTDTTTTWTDRPTTVAPPSPCSPQCIISLNTNFYKHPDPCWFIGCIRSGLSISCVEQPCKPGFEYCERSRDCIPSVRCSHNYHYCPAPQCPAGYRKP